MNKSLILIVLCILSCLSLFGIFTDVTQQLLGNLPAAVPGSGSLAFPDINSDGWADFYVSPYHFYLNNQNGTFTYRNPADLIAAGVPNTMHRPAFADADNDGDLDMVLSIYYGNQARYLENSGAPDFQFTGQVLYTHPTNVLGGQPSFVDGDADGLPEIYLSLFGNWDPNYAIGWDQYFKQNLQTHLWSNQTAAHFPQLSQALYRRPARGNVAADYDKDGDMDIFVANYGISFNENWEDFLWQNDGNGNFTDVAAAMNVNIEPHCRYGIGLGSGASWGDYDNDGDFDIALSNIHGWAAIYTNHFPAPFTNDTAACGLITTGAEKQWHNTLWVDIDNDNDLDLLLTQWYENYQSYVFRNDGPQNLGHFTDVTAEVGFNPTGNMNYCEGFVAGDYDRDGDMDISFYSNQAPNNGVWFFRNDLTVGNHWLVCNLQGNGTTTGKTALGSKIRIYFKNGDMSPLKQPESSSGDMVMNMIPVHFGFGNHDTFQEIRVDWLGGETEFYYPEDFNNQVDQYITLVQGSGHTGSRMKFVDQSYAGVSDGTEEHPYTSIQPAVNSAQNGFVIVVRDGMYFENLNLQDKAIAVVNPHGADFCMLSGSGSGSVVTAANNTGQISELMGMLLTEGNAVNGGGVNLQNGGMKLTNVKFATNSANQQGGAIYLQNSTLIIENCSFESNFAHQGGVFATDNSDLTITNCDFFGNSALGNASQANVGFLSSGSELIMTNGLLHHNSSDTASGSAIVAENSVITIYNSTISDNAAASGAALQSSASTLNLTNDIIWHNQPADYLATGGSQNLSHCDINAIVTGTDCLRAEPRFLDRVNLDYHLSNFSPCIGMGTVLPDVPASTFDFADTPRPMPVGSNPDMGCLENVRSTAAPINILVSTTGSDTNGDGSAAHPFASIQHALDVSIGGDTILVATGIYHENLIFGGKQTTVQSDFVYSSDYQDVENTIIDAGGNGRCVTFNQNESRAACLNGFTLRNGALDWGGAVMLDHASPTLKNLMITACNATDRGGAIFSQYGSPLLKGLFIHDNSSANRGGGIFLLNSPARIERCLLYQNSSANQGGAIAAYMCDPQIVNSTICDNACGTASTGGAIYGYSSDAVIVNSIFWDNTANPFAFTASSPVFTYCDIESGYTGEGNINLDPLFMNAGSGDYKLQAESPCLNAGTADFSANGTIVIHYLPSQYAGTAPDLGIWLEHRSK